MEIAWSELWVSLRMILLLITNDFLFRWFPYQHHETFLPWSHHILGRPLYTPTDMKRSPTILIVLGHPSPMFDFGSVENTQKIIDDWNTRDKFDYKHLCHFNTKLLIDSLTDQLAHNGTLSPYGSSTQETCPTTNSSPLIENSNKLNGIDNSSRALQIELLQVRRMSQSLPPPNKSSEIILTHNDFVHLRYREVFSQPIEGETEWSSYFSGDLTDGSDMADKRLTQNLFKQSCYIIFLYPVVWYGMPAALKSFVDSNLSAEFFALLPRHTIVSSIIWWIGRILYPFRRVRRFMVRYISQGLLRDKRAVIIETLGGPDPTYIGHDQRPLATALSYCGIDVKEVIALDNVATPAFSAWRRNTPPEDGETSEMQPATILNKNKCIEDSYWFKSWNKKIHRIANDAVKFCYRQY